MADEDRPTTWISAGHINNPPEDLRVQYGKVLVYADNGEPVTPQPDYPWDVETEVVPPPQNGG